MQCFYKRMGFERAYWKGDHKLNICNCEYLCSKQKRNISDSNLKWDSGIQWLQKYSIENGFVHLQVICASLFWKLSLDAQQKRVCSNCSIQELGKEGLISNDHNLFGGDTKDLSYSSSAMKSIFKRLCLAVGLGTWNITFLNYPKKPVLTDRTRLSPFSHTEYLLLGPLFRVDSILNL